MLALPSWCLKCFTQQQLRSRLCKPACSYMRSRLAGCTAMYASSAVCFVWIALLCHSYGYMVCCVIVHKDGSHSLVALHSMLPSATVTQVSQVLPICQQCMVCFAGRLLPGFALQGHPRTFTKMKACEVFGVLSFAMLCTYL